MRPPLLLPRLTATLALAGMLIGLSCGPRTEPVGYPGFTSPHAQPIALHPSLPYAYVTNTAGDTVEVIETTSLRIVGRIGVGIDPVSLAVRPDGSEVWVSNHISDSVSVIDADPTSTTFHTVIDTVQEISGGVTAFDEPVGVAFADDTKAYVALSSRNEIAVVDVASRSVSQRIEIEGQDPRALTVRDGKLYVIPFESGNQTQLSGCINGAVTPRTPWCSFDAVIESAANNILTTGTMVADIIKNDAFPDRDLFVFDTATDTLIEEVWTVGTLLYGIAVDSAGTVYVAQTEARNDMNGAAGTLGHDLIDLENRAFLNQIGVVDCGASCGTASRIELEPLPPQHPANGDQLATPFGVAISGDDTTLVATAAGSNRLFTLDTATGQVLGRVEVGTTPRGVAIVSDAGGAAVTAWVFNAVEDSVSVVDVSDPAAPTVVKTIKMADPTLPKVKRGRAAFNSALASTTGTYSCESCHPDSHTDQLLWILGARCDIPGCNQVQPRSTMPVRGLRDTLPLHWDGAIGDPFGGINTESLTTPVPPTCGPDEHSCFRDLVDGSLRGTMCDLTACPTDQNELGLPGALSEAERDDMAVFLASVPYPPARSRPASDDLSPLARQGFDDFLSNQGRPVCSRCHRLPFWVRTNTPGSGMDAPTFRGTTDRFLTLPNGRIYILDLLGLSVLASDRPWSPDQVPDEQMMWWLTFGTEANPALNRTSSGHGPEGMWAMFEEGSTGFSGAMGRQVTINATTATGVHLAPTTAIINDLEQADDNGVVRLRVGGKETIPASGGGTETRTLTLVYDAGLYRVTPDRGQPTRSRQDLLAAAAAGTLVATFTGRSGPDVDVDHPQPGLWTGLTSNQRNNLIQHLPGDDPMRYFARHIGPGVLVLVDGQRVGATVACQDGSTDLTSCPSEAIHIGLDQTPAVGQHLIQLATPGGLVSNDVLFFVD